MATQYSLGLPMSPSGTQTSIETQAQDVEWAMQMDMFYADLAQSEEQFVATLAEQTREYDLTLEEQMREYDETLEEKTRQFDLSYGLEEDVFEQAKYEWEEEFAVAQERWQADYDESQQQWEDYFSLETGKLDLDWEEFYERQETSDLKQTLLQQQIDDWKEEHETTEEAWQEIAGEDALLRGGSEEEEEEDDTSAASLWDTLAGWSAMSAAENLTSLQQEGITNALYPRSYGPSADVLATDAASSGDDYDYDYSDYYTEDDYSSYGWY